MASGNFSIWPLFNSHWQCFAVYDFFSHVECARITLEMQPYRYKRGIRILLWFNSLQMFGMFLYDHTTSMWLCLIWISKWRFVWLDIYLHTFSGPFLFLTTRTVCFIFSKVHSKHSAVCCESKLVCSVSSHTYYYYCIPKRKLVMKTNLNNLFMKKCWWKNSG